MPGTKSGPAGNGNSWQISIQKPLSCSTYPKINLDKAIGSSCSRASRFKNLFQWGNVSVFLLVKFFAVTKLSFVIVFE